MLGLLMDVSVGHVGLVLEAVLAYVLRLSMFAYHC